MSEAERRAGLSDWAPEEEDVREPLEVLTKSLNASRATPMARLLRRRAMVQRLENRLRITEFVKRHPEVEKHPIERPIFITGLPRTGTTLLQRLLARDPRTRTLRFWELTTPVLSSGLMSGESRTARIARLALHHSARAILLSKAGRRQMTAVHEILPDEPEECIPLLLNTFRSEAFLIHDELPEYLDWLRSQPLASNYGYYRKQLQVLTWGRDYDRIVLKCPLHLGHLSELLDVFPDARIIWTHRDPSRVLASNCSLLATFRGVRSEEIDPALIGRRTVEVAHWLLNGGTQAWERPGRHAFLHFLYPDLVANPLEAVRRIYKFIDQPLLHAAEDAMSSWLNADRRSGRPAHRYSLESFGLSPLEVAGGFADYRKQFQVPEENKFS